MLHAMMNKIDIHIFGVHSREEMIRATAQKLSLSEDHVHYGDRPNGGSVMYTAKKAWLAEIPDGVTHRVVLADDTQVCNGFSEICTQMANAHYDDIISLFPFEYMYRQPGLDRLLTPYVATDTLSGAGIIMPVKCIKPCFDWIDNHYPNAKEDDYHIQLWAIANGVRMLTTIPATLQHIGDDSIFNPQAPIRRTDWYEQNPVADWGCSMIAVIPAKEWFFSNHGKRPDIGGDIRYVS